MKNQITYTQPLGSGRDGRDRRRKWMAAARKQKMKFSAWVRTVGDLYAEVVLNDPETASAILKEKKNGGLS